MANLIIKENGVERTMPASHGEELTIHTPCDCTAVTGVQIAGVAYPFCDALGNSLANITSLFGEGSLIRVMIDTENTRAYILNASDMKASIYDPQGNAQDIFAYTDKKIAAIPTPDVSGQIATHNTDTAAHSDIRNAIPVITAGTTDLTAGISPLATGAIYLVYE